MNFGCRRRFPEIHRFLRSIERLNRQQRCCTDFLKPKNGLFLQKNSRYFSTDIETTVHGADVVVCGGGLLGTSVAYHLSKVGKNVVLLEGSRIGSGTVGVSSGFFSVYHLWCDTQTQNLARISNKLYKELFKDYPEIAYQKCSRLVLASDVSTLLSLRRMYSIAVSLGAKTKLLSSDEIEHLFPSLESADISLGLLVEDDAFVDPYALCAAMALEATKNGVRIIENCRVHAICIGDSSQVYGVDTDVGFLECRAFVDATGQQHGSLPLKGSTHSAIKLPLQPCTYSYLITKPLPGTHDGDPIVIHDLDKQVYLSYQFDDSFICGGFVADAVAPAEGSTKKSFEQQQPDWDMFYPILEGLTSRFPFLGKAQHDKLITGYEPYTPDGRPLIGEVPNLKRYWVVAGLSGHGVSLAGGAGSVLSDWICGEQFIQQDVSRLDVQRFLHLHANPNYLKLRAPEVASMSYKPIYSNHQSRTARNLRKSPIHQQLADKGAVFGEVNGFERPFYFVTDTDDQVSRMLYGHDSGIYGKPAWFDYVFEEYEACRERVGLIDMSSFAKYDIIGEDERVVNFLQYICSANVDKPVGTTIYTGMQNAAGGYVTDCTVSRLAPYHYFIVAPTGQQIRCRDWMERNKPKDPRIIIQDLTSMYTALIVLGPSSRYLMEQLTNQSMSPSAFPSFRCKELNVGFASGVRAISVSHCGELGWVLYAPNEFSQHVYENIIEAGSLHGLKHCGYYALRNLRMEKFYVYWGTDIGWTTTPFECGRDFRVHFDKADFIGKKALLEQKENGVKRRYVQVLVGGHNLHSDPWPVGREPIYRNGQFCGMTTSAAFGYTLGTQVCLGYIENVLEDGTRDIVSSSYVSQDGIEYTIDIAGHRFPAKINLHSPILPMVSSEHPVHFRPTQ